MNFVSFYFTLFSTSASRRGLENPPTVRARGTGAHDSSCPEIPSRVAPATVYFLRGTPPERLTSSIGILFPCRTSKSKMNRPVLVDPDLLRSVLKLQTISAAIAA